MRCSVWRDAAENVAESCQRGMRVIVSGRLKSRSYETKEGEKRTVVEMDVDEIGPSLRSATAKVNKTQRGGGGGGFGGGQGNQGGGWGGGGQGKDPWATGGSPRGQGAPAAGGGRAPPRGAGRPGRRVGDRVAGTSPPLAVSRLQAASRAVVGALPPATT